MIKRKILPVFLIFWIFVGSGLSLGSSAAEAAETKCKMHFSLRGWSAIYQTATGAATITCDNGQSAKVVIDTKGGGLTAGKSSLKGTGTFSGVSDISELYGAYAKAEAHAGVVKSAGAQVLTKGEVSLALAGTGKGIDLGISFGRFSIKPAGPKKDKK
ncbi:MAG: hypothetical protein HZB62_16395 [Nitrospirae bacterium]|nr:hypothetical protein [Nitrospirota bacterium]